jgi:hypothetical protein
MATHPLAEQSKKVAELVRELGVQAASLHEMRNAAFDDGTIDDVTIEEADWLPELERIVSVAQAHDQVHGNVSPRWATQQGLR